MRCRTGHYYYVVESPGVTAPNDRYESVELLRDGGTQVEAKEADAAAEATKAAKLQGLLVFFFFTSKPKVE